MKKGCVSDRFPSTTALRLLLSTGTLPALLPLRKNTTCYCRLRTPLQVCRQLLLQLLRLNTAAAPDSQPGSPALLPAGSPGPPSPCAAWPSHLRAAPAAAAQHVMQDTIYCQHHAGHCAGQVAVQQVRWRGYHLSQPQQLRTSTAGPGPAELLAGRHSFHAAPAVQGGCQYKPPAAMCLHTMRQVRIFSADEIHDA